MHEEKLSRFFLKNKILGIFANYVVLWKDLAYYITILINVFILGSFTKKNVDEDEGIGSIDIYNSYTLFN